MAAPCPFMGQQVGGGCHRVGPGRGPLRLCFQSRGRVSTQCTLCMPLPSLSLFSFSCFLFPHTPTLPGPGIHTRWARSLVPVPQCPNPCHGFGTVSNMISKCASWRLQGHCGLLCTVFAGTAPGLAHSKDGLPLAELVLGLPFRHLRGLASACLSSLLSQPVPSPDSCFPVSVPLDSVPSA